MPASRADLAAFATALASRLPGDWHTAYHQHSTYNDQFHVEDKVWNNGHVSWAFSEFVLGHDAQLSGPDGQRLCVIDRPLSHDQFLVVPLVPDEDLQPHHFHGVDEPSGIKVSTDPLRAAVAVSRRLLPRYGDALAAVRHNAHAQPKQPQRPAPPAVDQAITLTRYADGVIAAPYAAVPAEARMTLYAHGFHYNPHEAAFLLSAAYGDIGQAVRVQGVVQQLGAHGIGVNLRHHPPTPVTAPALTTAPTVPTTPHPAHHR